MRKRESWGTGDFETTTSVSIQVGDELHVRHKEMRVRQKKIHWQNQCYRHSRIVLASSSSELYVLSTCIHGWRGKTCFCVERYTKKQTYK